MDKPSWPSPPAPTLTGYRAPPPVVKKMNVQVPPQPQPKGDVANAIASMGRALSMR